MITIRLRRTGKTKQPSYRLIVSERSQDTTGSYLESLGTYNPRVQPSALVVKAERVQYWLGKGAYLSDTVHNLFVDQKLVAGPKRKNVAKSKKTDAAKGESAVPAAEVKAEAKPEEKPDEGKTA